MNKLRLIKQSFYYSTVPRTGTSSSTTIAASRSFLFSAARSLPTLPRLRTWAGARPPPGTRTRSLPALPRFRTWASTSWTRRRAMFWSRTTTAASTASFSALLLLFLLDSLFLLLFLDYLRLLLLYFDDLFFFLFFFYKENGKSTIRTRYAEIK